MVNNSFSFLLIFIMSIFRQDQKNQQDCFFTFLLFYPFYFFTES